MRTAHKLKERLSLVSEAVQQEHKRDRRVEGSIRFVFGGRELPVVNLELRQAILDADAENPWKDETVHRDDLKSVIYLSCGVFGMNNWGPGREDCSLSFKLQPEFDTLRPGQVHAYKKYLDNLGRVLLTRGFPVREILVVMTVTQVTYFNPNN